MLDTNHILYNDILILHLMVYMYLHLLFYVVYYHNQDNCLVSLCYPLVNRAMMNINSSIIRYMNMIPSIPIHKNMIMGLSSKFIVLSSH